MFTLKIDMQQVEAMAADLKVSADQLPYAMSRAMNEAAFATRRALVQDTWPQHVTQRRSNFPSAVLQVDVSDKSNLTVGIRETSNTAPSLTLHAEGGDKRPRKPGSHNLAIPLKGWAVRTEHGVRDDQTIARIIAVTPRRALRITKTGLFVGEGGKLHLRYSFKPSATQPKDVPFYEDFEAGMNTGIQQSLPHFMREAMRTRRAR